MMSLGRKVLAASLGALLLLLGCYALLATNLARWSDASAYVMIDYRRAMLDGQFHAALTRAVGESAAYALTGNQDYQNDAAAALRQAHEAARLLRQIAEPTAFPAANAHHVAFLQRQEHLLRLTEGVLSQARTTLAAPGKVAGTAGAAETVGSIYSQQADADALWQEIVGHHGAELFENATMLKVRSGQAQWLTLAGVVTFALVVTLLIHYVRRHIVYPLASLARLAGRVAGGDLTGRALVTRGDEIGQLQQSFNAMLVDLGKQRDELSALLDSLAHSRDVAQAASRAKTRFLANVSHEIRTPLHGVLISLDLLHETAPDPDQRELADAARASARSLLRMFNDLLDFSRIEAGSLPLDTIAFEPHALIMRTVEVHRRRATDKGLALSCHVADDVPASLCGDPLRVAQLLANLLDNAIKFTEHGSIDVVVARAPPPAASLAPPALMVWLRFCVKDTGVGVPPAAAQRIFEPFYQAEHALCIGQDGIGLGLGIARQLARRMHGELGFESEVEHGSSFWFTVGLQQHETAGAAVAPPPAMQPQQIPGGGSVLLVEDQRDIREVMARTLQRRGLTVATAEDGRVGLALATEQHFDLILMDCRMPVMDGFEATRAIRALGGQAARVPIVALTAYGLTEPKQRYLDAGFDDLVVKPYTLEDLEAALHRWLVLYRRDPAPPGETAEQARARVSQY